MDIKVSKMKEQFGMVFTGKLNAPKAENTFLKSLLMTVHELKSATKLLSSMMGYMELN